MDDILLTPEEIEKQKELFQYEMTQVILNLKGKYAKYDQSTSPIKGSKELSDKVLGSQADFVPLPEATPDIEKQNLPSLDKKANYLPLPGSDSDILIAADEYMLASAKETIEFKQYKRREIKLLSCEIPAAKGAAAFTPYDAVANVQIAADDNVLASAPEMIRYSQYENQEMVLFSCDVPAPETIHYTHYKNQEMAPLSCDVPAPSEATYVPYDAVSAVRIAADEHILDSAKETVKYIRYEDKEVEPLSYATPILTGEVAYIPYNTETALALPIIDPEHYVNHSIAYLPFSEAVEIKPLSESSIPEAAIEFKAHALPVIEELAENIPSLNVNADYSPLKVFAVEKLAIDIPSPKKPLIYAPISPIKASEERHIIPDLRNDFTFALAKEPLKTLPEFESPNTVKVPKFKPGKHEQIAKISATIPKITLDYEYSALSVTDEKQPGPIDMVPEELLAPKDFYAIWESL